MIASVISFIIKGVYAVLKFLNIRLLALVALVGVILHFAGAFTVYPSLSIYFWIVVALAVVINIVGRVIKHNKKKKGVPKKKGVQIVKNNEEDYSNYNPYDNYKNANAPEPQQNYGGGNGYQNGGYQNNGWQNNGYQNNPYPNYGNQNPQPAQNGFPNFNGNTYSTWQAGNSSTNNYQQNSQNGEEAPKYFKVKNSNCYMAEFVDRYELYKSTPSGLVKIRTDYK